MAEVLVVVLIALAVVWYLLLETADRILAWVRFILLDRPLRAAASDSTTVEL